MLQCPKLHHKNNNLISRTDRITEAELSNKYKINKTIIISLISTCHVSYRLRQYTDDLSSDMRANIFSPRVCRFFPRFCLLEIS